MHEAISIDAEGQQIHEDKGTRQGSEPARDLLYAGGQVRWLDGTPIELYWYATMLPSDRRTPATSALRRFLSTPDAMQAMHRSDGGVPASRFRPPVYVTLWS